MNVIAGASSLFSVAVCIESLSLLGRLHKLYPVVMKNSCPTLLVFPSRVKILIRLSMMQAMEKTRSTESNVFKKKPSDFMQMLKVIDMSECTSVVDAVGSKL